MPSATSSIRVSLAICAAIFGFPERTAPCGAPLAYDISTIKLRTMLGRRPAFGITFVDPAIDEGPQSALKLSYPEIKRNGKVAQYGYYIKFLGQPVKG